MTDTIDLRRVMLVDVAFSATSALALLVFAGPLGGWLSLEPALLRWVGVLLAGHVAALSWSVVADRIDAGTRYAGVANLGWVVAAVAVLVAGWLTSTAAIALAVVSLPVGVLGALQWRGLR